MLSECRDYIQSASIRKGNSFERGEGVRGAGFESQTSLLIFECWDFFFFFFLAQKAQKALFNERVPTILQLVVAASD